MMQPLKQESSDGAAIKQEKLNPISFVGKVKEVKGNSFTIHHKKTVMRVQLDSNTELLDGDKTLDIAPDEAVQPGVKVQIVGLLNKRLNLIKAVRLYIFHKEFDINYFGAN
ncbi:hypothetical protein [Fictibacillus phosphorivorans]|uniref:hypothetical protein n=1 Tax=Fictibacillus phosphorivorans TaxID=1221500 RepID=UPI00203BA84D|nr:hypothetical protein [Fictibacillus phosphorivorans]MCM3718242.1 hypothetical protein [Fictibacillus phosphorivorans]MCM3775891.1 hypothetical protein [Fictibacillus phosphorivorans]